jgi:hypothetical protein
MAATKYTYSISGDFPNQKVDINRLTKEIRESDIVTALDYINVSEDDCDIWFKDALSAGDQTILDGIVANHSGEPLPDAAKPVTIDGARFDKDGKQVIVTTPADSGAFTWYTSRGDILPPALARGEGTEARITYAASATGIEIVELQFAESVYVHDGEINWKSIDEFDGSDHFSVYVKFDQTDVVVNPGSTGNCNVIDGYLIIPAAGDGGWDVDLDAACPIPSSAGPWVVNERTEAITIYTEGQDLGKHGQRIVLMTGIIPPDLYLVRNVAMGSPRGVFEIDAYLVEWVSSHWKIGMEVNKVKSPNAEVEINGVIMLFRWNGTTNGAV